MPTPPLDSVRQRAQQLAQDAADHGVQLLLAYPGDYDQAITHALLTYNQDRPNVRVVDHTPASAAWRFPLTGATPITGLTGVNAFVNGASALREVWAPYVADPDATPLAREAWRVQQDPAALVLELLQGTLAAGQVLRLAFTAPHVVTMESSTVPTHSLDVLALLAASLVLQLAANRAVQNTGSTGLPNDIVDRRSQSDMFRSRAKELRDQYQQIVGTRRGNGPVASSATRDLDVGPGTPLGFLWRNTRRS
jgi:hypothetical protein